MAATPSPRVGKTEIGLEQMRTAYQNDVQNLTRQQRRQITPDMARALGLDRQVLSRLITEATLDQTAQRHAACRLRRDHPQPDLR